MYLRKRRLLCYALLFTVFSGKAAIPGSAAGDQDRIVLNHREVLSFDQMLEDVSKADVVVIGEQHDHKLGHKIELEILQGIYAKNPSVALSLEMFERDVQLVLDEYLNDEITSSSFLAASRPWPNYKTDYAPLVEFCKANSLPVIAANAPRRYVNIASTKGQKALLDFPKKSREYLAKLPYSMDLPPEYDKNLTEIFSAHDTARSGKTDPANSMPPPPKYMKEGQALWDATMADSIVIGRRKTHRKLILQINGAMHSDSKYGLVDRLSKSAPKLKILTISIAPDENFPHPDSAKYDTIADFVIVTGIERQKSQAK